MLSNLFLCYIVLLSGFFVVVMFSIGLSSAHLVIAGLIGIAYICMGDSNEPL